MNEKVSKIVNELVELHKQANEAKAKADEAASRVTVARKDAAKALDVVDEITDKIEAMNQQLSAAVAEVAQ